MIEEIVGLALRLGKRPSELIDWSMEELALVRAKLRLDMERY